MYLIIRDGDADVQWALDEDDKVEVSEQNTLIFQFNENKHRFEQLSAECDDDGEISNETWEPLNPPRKR